MSDDLCIICLCEGNVYFTVCRHTFHKKCLQEWFNTGTNKCPCCRTELDNL
jgi:hypothetical protein